MVIYYLFNFKDKINGTKILEISILERRQIIYNKKTNSDKNNTFYN